MNRYWIRLAALLMVAAGALIGLGAREDEAKWPDDLARVPANARAVSTVHVAELWNSDLGKEVRTAFGKELDKSVAHLRDTLGLLPEDIERATALTTDLMAPDGGAVLIVRAAKKLDAAAVLAKITRDGKAATIAGQKVVTGTVLTAFVGGDGRTLVFGVRSAIEALLEAKPARATGPLALMLQKAGKHHVTGYFDPSPLEGLADKLPPALGAVKPLLAAKGGVAWMDVGFTTKLGMKLTFADEKTASRGRKAIDAGRALGSLTLSGLGDSVAGKSKPLASLMKRVEQMLDDGTVEQKGTAVEAAMALTVEKATVAGLIQETLKSVVAAAGRTRAANNLKQIGLALHNYHDAHGAFPPQAVYDKDGKALLSWRVMILPYVEQDALYKEFRLDEPWDSDHNKKLIPKIPPVFVSPHGKASAVGGTFYQAFHGKTAAFEGKSGMRLANFTDGTSNTILVAEAAKDVPWTKPDDLPFDPDGKLPKLGGLFDGGFNALFGDGSVRFMSRLVKPDVIKMMVTRNGGEVIPREE